MTTDASPSCCAVRDLLSCIGVIGCCLVGVMAQAQPATDATGLGSTITPATPDDPVVHHHKAYPKISYGISCPGDRVVWVNTKSGVYHLEGERWFGRTKSGDYECEKAVKAEGDSETLNGQ